jgi:hypothetical protein
MDIDYCTRQLHDNAERISMLVLGTTDQEARWKPEPGSWSILEVVNHLYDEEREDFRTRLDIIIHYPQKQWPAIDPEGWVTARKYNERDLGKSLQKFLAERDRSLKWLKKLDNPSWNSEYSAPFGTIRAGDIFAAWVTHDHLHMRQLIELHRELTVNRAKPYHLDYAGSW